MIKKLLLCLLSALCITCTAVAGDTEPFITIEGLPYMMTSID